MAQELKLEDLMGPGSKMDESPEDSVVSGEGGAPEPISKKAAGYRPAEDDAACGNCANFVEPEGCTRVLGQIEATGVCDLWEIAETEGLLGAEGATDFLFSGGSEL